jgi:ATP-binding cassette subfamily B protein
MAPSDERSPTTSPLRYLAQYRLPIGAGILCLVGTNLMAQAIPWVVKRTVEAVEHAATGWAVGRLALVIAAMALGQALMRIPSRIFIFNAARQAEYHIRNVLFTRLVQADSGFYRRFRIGDLMSRLTNDLASVRALYGPGVLHVVNTVFAYAIALPVMLRIDPGLTLWSLLPYPVLLLGARSFARGIYSRSRRMQVALAGMSSGVQEDLAGIREVKLYGVEEHRAARFGEVSAGYLHHAVRLAGWRAALIPFVGIGTGASLVVVLWLGGVKVIDGRLTLGDLVAINLYVGMLAWPTMSIGWILSLWQRGIASWHRLQEIFGMVSPLEVDLSAAAAVRKTEKPAPPAISARGLSLSIDDNTILADIDLEVPPGSICAVVGRVGCGKTSLVEAIARLVEVAPGTLFFDGKCVTELPVEQARALVAYAPQTAFLFSATVRENIAFGLQSHWSAFGPSPRAHMSAEDAETERINWAVKVAGLVPDLSSFPDGLDTLVGERGLSLSGGQRQRIALARALVADRPVLLLDDSLSSVDADTERRILEGLAGALEGRTVILVSHRLSALQHADHVLVLDGGTVSERGTHAELLAREGSLYGQLYRRQLLMQELEIDDSGAPSAPDDDEGWELPEGWGEEEPG